ncbi:MAG: lipid II:glycine glycyltransferase FemX [Anaerolineae bacterium]
MADTVRTAARAEETAPAAGSDLLLMSGATLSDAAWDAFVCASPQGHLLQTSQWGALKQRFGWSVERIALAGGGRIVAGMQVLFRPLPTGVISLAYVPMGPIVDWYDDAAVRALLRAARQVARRRRAFMLKIEPVQADDPVLAQRLSHLGLRPARLRMQDQQTIVVDLRGSEEDVLARFGRNTRYKVRSAARKGVTVRVAEAQGVPLFDRLIQATAERHHIAMHGASYYRAAYELFAPNGQVGLLLAENDGQVLAGMMVFAMGERSWNVYTASSDTHRDLMPNYLLQWEAMRWARQRGCTSFDLWGIPDADEEALEKEFTQRSDGLWGVYGFKRGFGGQVVRYMDAYDDVYMQSLHWLSVKASEILESKWGETWHRRLRSE